MGHEWMRNYVRKTEVVDKYGIGEKSKTAYELVGWAVELNDLRKAKRILNVAKKMEQRYRDWHGLERLAGM